jgi:cytochrome c-type biogenesis protein CcmF
VQGPNYQAVRAYVDVSKDEQLLTALTPEKRIYTVQKNPMTEASIDTGIFRDLYVALGEPVSDQEWGIRIYYRPFIQWIWFGTILMSIGGILGATDKRYRLGMK